MIIEDKIEILITPRNITYYRNLNYVVKFNDRVLIPIEHLPLTCKMEVTCRCECGAEIKMRYEKYVINVNRCGYYGCKKCSNKKRVIISQEKWGVDNYSQTQECKDLIAINNMEKYGVKTTLLVDDVKEKIKATNLEKYNTEHPLASDKIREKGKHKYLRSVKNTYIEINEKGYKFINGEDSIYSIECPKKHIFNIDYSLLYNRVKETHVELCTICNPKDNKQSNFEREIITYISNNYNGIIIESDRKKLNGKELDIYLPDLNIAFECNGLYWHCELEKNNLYHIDKTNNCEKIGIHLIHIWEDDWKNKSEIIKSKINNILKGNNKIYARKCNIVILSNKECRNFLQENHLQGAINSSINIGLLYNNDLISLMTFGKLRKNLNQSNIEDVWEMYRFCNKLNTVVVGGASKLFKYFTNEYNPKMIISYADRSWSWINNNLYTKLGFDFNNYTQPNYHYIINNTRRNRFNFRKDVLIKEGFDPLKSEHEIMLERGYYRIYNSGNLKFEWKKSIPPFPSNLS